MSDSFSSRVLDPIRAHSGSRTSPPRREGLTWSFEEGPEFREVQLTIDASELGGSLRNDGPASPVFALCLAAALGETAGAPTRASVRVVGKAPPPPGLGYKTSKELLQFRRASFLLGALSELLGDRFQLAMADADRWTWPKWTWFAIEGYRKNKERSEGSRERLAWQLELDPGLFKTFGEGVEPIRRFQSHMPVVVHSGEVTKESHWTVGGKTGVGLWVASADDRRLHVFELDVGARGSVGCLAEALCNGLMLDYVFNANGHYDPTGVGLAAVRRARRMVMWLTARAYHPLVFDVADGDSAVLRWLNRPLRRRSFQMGVLPWQGEIGAPQLRYEARWGGGFK